MKKLLISLALATMLVAVMATPAMAVTGTTDITGNVAGVIEVTAPVAISLGNMALGDNASGVKTGTIKANAAWTMTAKDVKVTDPGYMVAGGNKLTSKMQISKDDTTWLDADAVSPLTYSGTATAQGGDSFNFYAKQNVVWADPVADSYSITITFTATLD